MLCEDEYFIEKVKKTMNDASHRHGFTAQLDFLFKRITTRNTCGTFLSGAFGVLPRAV